MPGSERLELFLQQLLGLENEPLPSCLICGDHCFEIVDVVGGDSLDLVGALSNAVIYPSAPSHPEDREVTARQILLTKKLTGCPRLMRACVSEYELE